MRKEGVTTLSSLDLSNRSKGIIESKKEKKEK